MARNDDALLRDIERSADKYLDSGDWQNCLYVNWPPVLPSKVLGTMSGPEAVKYREENSPYFKQRLPHHAQWLASKGIGGALSDSLNIFSAQNGPATAYFVDNGRCEGCGPSVVIPYFDEYERCVHIIARPDKPRSTDDDSDKPIKYESRYGNKHPPIYFPCGRDTFDRLKNPNTPIVLFCEGPLKAAAAHGVGYCAIGLNGVDTWHKSRSNVLRSEIQRILQPLKRIGRVGIVADSDYATNDRVRGALDKFAHVLRKENIDARIVQIPDTADDPRDVLGNIVDLSNVLARGTGREDLIEYIDTAFAAPAPLPLAREATPLDMAHKFLDYVRTPDIAFGYGGEFWERAPALNLWLPLPVVDLECMVRDYLNSQYSDVRRAHVHEVVSQLQSLTKLPRDITPPALRCAEEDAPEILQCVDFSKCIITRRNAVDISSIKQKLDISAVRVWQPWSLVFNTSALDVEKWDPNRRFSGRWQVSSAWNRSSVSHSSLSATYASLSALATQSASWKYYWASAARTL